MYQFFNLFGGVAKMKPLGTPKEALSTKKHAQNPSKPSQSLVYAISPQNIEKIVHWYTASGVSNK